MSGELDYASSPGVQIHLSGGQKVLYFPREVWGPDAAQLINDWTPADRRQALNHGQIPIGRDPTTNRFLYADEPLAQRVRRMVLGETFEAMPAIFDPTSEGLERDYVPGLWTFGAKSGLVGPKGFGKTLFNCQLAAALITPYRPFLGVFNPIELTDEERMRDVWMLNPKTLPMAVHNELLKAGLLFGRRDGIPVYYSPVWGIEGGGCLIVDHLLKNRQGSTVVDFADEAKARWWKERFLTAAGKRPPPLTVVADDVTALTGNSTARTGEFTSAFISRMSEWDIPNALGVMHSPMTIGADYPMHGIESAAQWNGLWLAHANDFPVGPNSRRTFSTNPELGGPIVPEQEFVLDENGMGLLIPLSSRSKKAETKSVEADRLQEDEYWEAKVIERLTDAGKDGLGSTELTGRSREGELMRAARDRLAAKGLISSKPAGLSVRWYLIEFQ